MKYESLNIILFIIRPHRSATYVNAIYCYRLSSVVCRSVGLSVMIVSLAKTAEPIEILFGLWTQVGPKNHVLDKTNERPHNSLGPSDHEDLLLCLVFAVGRAVSLSVVVVNVDVVVVVCSSSQRHCRRLMTITRRRRRRHRRYY